VWYAVKLKLLGIGVAVAVGCAACGSVNHSVVSSGKPGSCRNAKTGVVVKALHDAGLVFEAYTITHGSQGQIAKLFTLTPHEVATTGFLDLEVFKTCAGATQQARRLNGAPGATVLHYANVAGLYSTTTASGDPTPDRLSAIEEAIRRAIATTS
jgi:hypothetical protein